MEFNKEEIEKFSVNKIVKLMLANRGIIKSICDLNLEIKDIVTTKLDAAFLKEHIEHDEQLISCVFLSMTLAIVDFIDIFNAAFEMKVDDLLERFNNNLMIATIISPFLKTEVFSH